MWTLLVSYHAIKKIDTLYGFHTIYPSYEDFLTFLDKKILNRQKEQIDEKSI